MIIRHLWTCISLGLLYKLPSKTVYSQTCTHSGTRIVNTCSGESEVGKYLNIFHTNPLNVTYDTVCECTITGNSGDLIEMDIDNIPGKDNRYCGTKVDIVKPDRKVIYVTCTDVSSTGTKHNISLQGNDTISVVYNIEANATYSTSSSFCFYFEDKSPSNMTISCALGYPRTTGVMISTKADRNFQTTAAVNITTADGSILTDSPATTIRTSTDNTSLDYTTTFEAEVTHTQQQQESQLIIVIPSLAGGFLLVMVAIIAIVCIRARKANKEISNIPEVEKDNNTTQSKQQDGLELSSDNDDEMRVNPLYESVDAIDVKDTDVDNTIGGYSNIKLSSKEITKSGYLGRNNSALVTESENNQQSNYTECGGSCSEVNSSVKEKEQQMFPGRKNDYSEIEISGNEDDFSNHQTQNVPISSLHYNVAKTSPDMKEGNLDGPVYALPVKKKKM